MAGLIWVTQEDSWLITGRGYIPLLQRAMAVSGNEADRKVLRDAELFQLLDFGELEPSQRVRLGRAVARGAEELQQELLLSDDPVDQTSATRWGEIAVGLRNHFG